MDQRSLLKRVVFALLIGATVEWYDFFLYGVVSGIVFNQLYFPAADPVVSTLLAYTTFAVGFVTRPLGGVIFGHFGDRIDRKSMLGPDVDDHGRRDVLDWPCADVRADRSMGPHFTFVSAHSTGYRPRRRMRRRSPDAFRICAAWYTWTL